MIRELLADSLAVWKLPGSVTEREQDVLIHTEGGVTVTVAAISESARPFRWRVQRAGGAPRNCVSIAGALSAVREALEVPAGPALRIAPAGSGA